MVLVVQVVACQHLRNDSWEKEMRAWRDGLRIVSRHGDPVSVAAEADLVSVSATEHAIDFSVQKGLREWAAHSMWIAFVLSCCFGLSTRSQTSFFCPRC